MSAYRQYFEILGLDAPPADRKAVKRAYSKMLKVTRPEDDPDGFMQLRDAHDQALNILKWEAEEAEWKAQNAQEESALTAEKDNPFEETTSEVEPVVSPEPGLTYSDMLPEPQPEPVSETSYAIGPTPNFDAPVTLYEQEQNPAQPKAPPLIEELHAILDDPKQYNDRERWNVLFRKARQLDIDDYVDFEELLLVNILRFHGYFEDHLHHNTPGKMPQKLSPSITASLFKTMSWDQVNKHGLHRDQQIEWLERRMSVRKRGVEPVPIPETNSSGSGNIWMWLFGLFVLAKIVQALANS